MTDEQKIQQLCLNLARAAFRQLLMNSSAVEVNPIHLQASQPPTSTQHYGEDENISLPPCHPRIQEKNI